MKTISLRITPEIEGKINALMEKENAGIKEINPFLNELTQSDIIRMAITIWYNTEFKK